MTQIWITAGLLLLAALAYREGRRRALAGVGGRGRALHSRPGYYGAYLALWCAVPALALLVVWLALEPMVTRSLVVAGLPAAIRDLPAVKLDLVFNDIRNLARGDAISREPDAALLAAAGHYKDLKSIGGAALGALACAAAATGFFLGRRRIAPTLRARNLVERVLLVALVASSVVAILTTIGIVLSLLVEALRFFAQVSPFEFLTGLEWSPQTAIRADQVGASGSFGAVPVFVGTVQISVVAMLVAGPVGLFSAIYMAEYASPRFRAAAKPALEILAGVPTVVYGFFAALIVAPYLRDAGESIGLDVASESALAAGLVMGIMIIPFVSSISDDVIAAVPSSLREGSYGLGATRAETITKVVLPAALPGIAGGMLLAVSRAIGETMIVVMAAGLAANLTANPFQAVTTVTVQIVTLLIGDQEFDSPKTLAAFALGLVLFLATLLLNVAALIIVRRFRERYD